jgi:hypothetical protein
MLKNRRIQCLCFAFFASGLGSTHVLALSSSVPVTWVTNLEQLPVPVRRSYQEDCVLPNELEPDFTEKSETGGIIAKLADGRELYILTCSMAAANVAQDIFLFDGVVAENLEFPHQDELGNVSYERGSMNTRYEGEGVIVSVASGVCNEDHMADSAKLQGDQLLPFVPKTGRIVCQE